VSTTHKSTHGFAEVAGTRLYYEIAGEGYPLVLMHGGIMDNTMWDDQFEAFAQRYGVMRYDLRGFGQSDLPAGPEPYSMRGDLREQVTLVDTLATKIPGAQKAVMHGVAHLPNMERPAEFNRLVLDFLKAL
jgi:pimeloyl-ACP methyl ester carboxylesterase